MKIEINRSGNGPYSWCLCVNEETIYQTGIIATVEDYYTLECRIFGRVTEILLASNEPCELKFSAKKDEESNKFKVASVVHIHNKRIAAETEIARLKKQVEQLEAQTKVDYNLTGLHCPSCGELTDIDGAVCHNSLCDNYCGE